MPSSLLLAAVGLCQGLAIGFSATFSLCLLEMSDRWWPLVYIPCICCKALIYLIRRMCGEGGGVCRSRMEHFIMSVKHKEPCTELDCADRRRGRGIRGTRWCVCRYECFCAFYGLICGANQANVPTYVHRTSAHVCTTRKARGSYARA